MLARMQRNWIAHILLVRRENDTATPEKIWSVPFKTKNALTNKPALALLGTYLREMKTYLHIIIIKKLETTQITFNKWVVKQSVVCQKKKKKKEYFSATRQNKSLIHVTTWKNLKEIILSEKSQLPKDIH